MPKMLDLAPKPAQKGAAGPPKQGPTTAFDVKCKSNLSHAKNSHTNVLAGFNLEEEL